MTLMLRSTICWPPGPLYGEDAEIEPLAVAGYGELRVRDLAIDAEGRVAIALPDADGVLVVTAAGVRADHGETIKLSQWLSIMRDEGIILDDGFTLRFRHRLHAALVFRGPDSQHARRVAVSPRTYLRA